MTKWEIHEEAGKRMFSYFCPAQKVNHQYEEYKLDFLHLEKPMVGEIKIRSANTDAYDNGKGLIIEQTKINHFLEAKQKYGVIHGVLLYFNADGMALFNMADITDYPSMWQHFIQSSYTEKQQGSSDRELTTEYHIPSKHWGVKYYTPEQKVMYDEIVAWRDKELDKLRIKRQNELLELLNK